MVNRIVTVDLSGSNKGFNSKHCVDSQVRREAPEEGRKTYRPKLCDYNHKYKVNSSNILSNNNYRASLGGARGVMVIVVGIGHGDTSSNPGLIAFHIALIPLGKV